MSGGGDSVQVTPDELKGAAGTVDRLGGDFPSTGADDAAAALPGSATAQALAQTEAALQQAHGVIKGRFQTMSQLLTTSADHYDAADDKTENALARQLDSMGELNPG